MIYKGSSKFIIHNNNVIYEKVNNEWVRVPFYNEKTIDDEAEHNIIIEHTNNTDYYVKLYVIRDDEDNYSDDKYVKIPIEIIKKHDFDNKYIDDNLLSISALSITKYMVKYI